MPAKTVRCISDKRAHVDVIRQYEIQALIDHVFSASIESYIIAQRLEAGAQVEQGKLRLPTSMAIVNTALKCVAQQFKGRAE